MSEEHMSKGQFGRISDAIIAHAVDTANAGEGFSVRAYPPNAGDAARDSYMAGIPGHTEDHPGGATHEAGVGYVTGHRAALSASGHHWGGWHSDGRTSFDVAKAFPRTPGGMVRARLTATRSNQESIGEVDENADYVGDIDNPHYQSDAGHSGSFSTVATRSWSFEPIRTRR